MTRLWWLSSAKNDESAYRTETQLHRGDHQEHQIPWCSPGGELHLVPQHQLYNQESLEVSLHFVEAKKSPSLTPIHQHILQRDHREHTEQMHYCLNWKLH
ncbi:hypothetical protein QTP70_021746, partial [Hemibagrus guttatus]